LLFIGCFYFDVENNHSHKSHCVGKEATTVPNKQKVTKGDNRQIPTLYSVAELVLGFKTEGNLHQPFPPADNTQTVE
jgi:hypothetical protein